MPPDTIARAGEGDEAAMGIYVEPAVQGTPKKTSAEQRPSMGQDMQKGRRTEIEFLNGFVVREGKKVGLACRANAVLHRHRHARGERRAEARPAPHRGAPVELIRDRFRLCRPQASCRLPLL